MYSTIKIPIILLKNNLYFNINYFFYSINPLLYSSHFCFGCHESLETTSNSPFFLSPVDWILGTLSNGDGVGEVSQSSVLLFSVLCI